MSKGKKQMQLDSLRKQYGSLGRIVDRTELPSLPKPVPMIEGWLDTRSSVVMIGATGTNKTFTLLGWACSVATGVPWLGHEVAIDPSPVIYVVGEGASGFDSRIAAWEAEHETEVPRDRLLLLLQPDSLTDETFWEELGDLARQVGSRLVILDTFSSLAPDADETSDAARVVRRMSDLSTEIDGAVILAHHTGWGPQNRARGGSQLEANPDGTVVLQKLDEKDPDSVVSVWRKKDKDGPSGKTIHVARVPVGRSCVLEVVDAPAGRGRQTSGAAERDADLMRKVLEVLREAGEDGLNITAVRKAVSRSSERVREAIDELEARGQISTREVSFKGSNDSIRSKPVYVFKSEKIRLRAVHPGGGGDG